MRSFEILGISTFSDIEKVDAAYEQKLQELSGNREIYPDSLFEKKVHELAVAKEDCIAYLSSSAKMRIKKQLSESYDYHMQSIVLHDCGTWLCCTPCCSAECFEFGATRYPSSFLGDYCCFDSILCSPAAMICYAIICGITWNAGAEEREKQRAQNKKREEKASQERRQKIEAERQEKERRHIIAEKTKEISKQSQFLDADLIQWKKLQHTTPCTLQDLKACDRLLTLLENVGENKDDISAIRHELIPHRKAAEEKQEIMTRALTVAQLYRDIGNPEAAEGLLKKYNPEKR